MCITFIEESEKTNIIKGIFNRLKYTDGKIIINCKLHKLNIKKKIKLSRKIKRILNLEKSSTVIVSKKIKEDKEFINILYSNNIELIDGRNLFKRLAIDIVEYIIKKNKMDIKNLKISIMANSYNKITESIIKNLCIRCKKIQIITNHISKYEKIEDTLYEEGIIINITNNKRKSMRDSNIILNMDFPNETINKYNIYENAIIVNFEEKIKINKKRFSGTIINWYKASIKNKEQIFELIQEQDVYKYDFNEIIEYLYFLNKIKAEDIYVESLITK